MSHLEASDAGARHPEEHEAMDVAEEEQEAPEEPTEEEELSLAALLESASAEELRLARGRMEVAAKRAANEVASADYLSQFRGSEGFPQTVAEFEALPLSGYHFVVTHSKNSWQYQPRAYRSSHDTPEAAACASDTERRAGNDGSYNFPTLRIAQIAMALAIVSLAAKQKAIMLAGGVASNMQPCTTVGCGEPMSMKARMCHICLARRKRSYIGVRQKSGKSALPRYEAVKSLAVSQRAKYGNASALVSAPFYTEAEAALAYDDLIRELYKQDAANMPALNWPDKAAGVAAAKAAAKEFKQKNPKAKPIAKRNTSRAAAPQGKDEDEEGGAGGAQAPKTKKQKKTSSSAAEEPAAK